MNFIAKIVVSAVLFFLYLLAYMWSDFQLEKGNLNFNWVKLVAAAGVIGALAAIWRKKKTPSNDESSLKKD